MSWLLFKQTMSGNVSYLSDKSENLQFLSYDKFLYFLVTNFYVKDFNKLKYELDSFNIIFFNCETGEWNIKQPNLSHFTFDELLSFNPSKKNKNSKEINKEVCFEKLQKVIKKKII